MLLLNWTPKTFTNLLKLYQHIVLIQVCSLIQVSHRQGLFHKWIIGLFQIEEYAQVLCPHFSGVLKVWIALVTIRPPSDTISSVVLWLNGAVISSSVCVIQTVIHTVCGSLCHLKCNYIKLYTGLGLLYYSGHNAFAYYSILFLSIP